MTSEAMSPNSNQTKIKPRSTVHPADSDRPLVLYQQHLFI